LQGQLRPLIKMNKSVVILKKTLKVILWVIIGFVILFVAIAVLIQIPAVQNRIVQKATSFVSSKTNTRIEINKISISFPKAIVIQGLFLEDTKQDTLLYAGKAKINIALYGLLSSRIAISSFVLEDAIINLYSTKTDSLFNYNFLITAFSNTNGQVNPDEEIDQETFSKWTFNLDNVVLRNVRFTYNDEYSGIGVFAAALQSEISLNEINPKKSIYSFDEILMEGLNVNVLTSETTNTKADQPGKILPVISANKLELRNSLVNYTDSVINLAVHSVIDFLKLEDALIDLNPELIIADYLFVKESRIHYHSFAPEPAGSQADIVSDLPSGNNWKVTLNKIEATDNSFTYKIGNTLALANEFDPANIELNHLVIPGKGFLLCHGSYQSFDQEVKCN
jgi:translocation and assembly module TamB